MSNLKTELESLHHTLQECLDGPKLNGESGLICINCGTIFQQYHMGSPQEYYNDGHAKHLFTFQKEIYGVAFYPPGGGPWWLWSPKITCEEWVIKDII